MSNALRILLSLAVAAVLLLVLWTWGDLDRDVLAETLRSLPVATWLVALGIHATLYVLRALRFRLLLPAEHRPPLSAVVAVGAAHNLAAFVLPAKTGEAALVVYLKRVCGVPGAFGLATLLVSRILDLGVLAGTVGVACLVARPIDGAAAPGWLAPLGVALLLGSVVLFVLATRGHRLVGLYRALARGTGFLRTRLGARVEARAVEVADSLRCAGSRWSGAALLSLPMWVLAYLFYAVLARGFGLPETVTLAEAAFGSGLAMVANLLPINGLAGFGTQEAGWVVGFHLLGVPRDVALSTGLGAHAVQLANIVLMGIVGHVAMGLVTRRVASPSDAR